MARKRPIRLLLAKPGLDAHDIGVKTVAYSLRDAGMEVIYLGLRQTPEFIMRAAIQEDADIIGLSCHGAALVPLGERLMQLLKENAVNIPVIYGGTILGEDRERLLNAGIKTTFSPGTKMKDIIKYVEELVEERS